MTNDPSREGTERHQSLAAYRAAGGQPADHSHAEMLLESASTERWVYPEERLALLVAIPAAKRTSTHLWEMELHTDPDVAEWFLAGFPAEVVAELEAAARREWDRQHRPWRAELVVHRDGFTCSISGRTDGVEAVEFTPRLEDWEDDLIVVHPDEITGVIERGRAAIREGMTMAERMGSDPQRRRRSLLDLDEQLAARSGTASPDVDGADEGPS